MLYRTYTNKTTHAQSKSGKVKLNCKLNRIRLKRIVLTSSLPKPQAGLSFYFIFFFLQFVTSVHFIILIVIWINFIERLNYSIILRIMKFNDAVMRWLETGFMCIVQWVYETIIMLNRLFIELLLYMDRFFFSYGTWNWIYVLMWLNTIFFFAIDEKSILIFFSKELLFVDSLLNYFNFNKKYQAVR